VAIDNFVMNSYHFIVRLKPALSPTSLVPRPHLSQGKRSGEPSPISWAYYRNVVRTNKIALLLTALTIAS